MSTNIVRGGWHSTMDWKPNAGQIKQDFERDGYCIIRNHLSTQETAQVRENVERFVSDVLPGLPKDKAYYEDKDDAGTLMRLQGMMEDDDYFGELYRSEQFLGLADHLLDGARESQMQWFDKPPRVGKATPPHQDGFYFMLEPNEALTLWLAIDVADEENGCVRYVPGSHRRDMRPHRPSGVLGFSQGIVDYGDEDFATEVPMVAQPGDVIAHHCLTIHRADGNPSDRHRAALGFHYHAKRAVADAQRRETYQKQLVEQWEAEGKL
jgi:phytanoyl-CoA hydroxylase